MTTFIDLTNELLRRINEVPIAEADFSSVRGVQSVAKDVINASISAINQDEYEWPFNIGNGTQTLTAGTEDYSWPSDLLTPNWQSFHLVKDDTLGIYGTPLQFISRDEYHKINKDRDDDSGSDGVGVPVYVLEKHGEGFTVTPSPDEAYQVKYEYFKKLEALVDHDDVSTIPEIYDEAIIQGGLYHFYMFRDNVQHAALAERMFRQRVGRMRTILINKEDKIRSTQLNHYNLIGGAQYGERLYPL